MQKCCMKKYLLCITEIQHPIYGIEFSRLLKQFERKHLNRNLPIIAISSCVEEMNSDMIGSAVNSGVREIIYHPVDN